MSVEFFEGFETVGTEVGLANEATTRPRIDLRWSDTNSGGTPSTDSFFLIADNFSEGYAIQMGNNSFSNGNYLEWDVPAAKQEAPGASAKEWVIGFRVHTPSTSRTWNVLTIYGSFGSDTEVLDLQIENCANINVNRGNPGAFEIGNADAVLTTNQWYYIEVKFKIAEAADGGYVKVYLDGNLIIDETGDTNNALTLGFTYARFKTTNADTGNDFVAFDDIYILDCSQSPHTDVLGPVRVRSLPPSGDVEAGWTPDSGSTNYTQVNENGADDSDYVITDFLNTRDRYNMTNLSDPAQVFAAKVEAEVTNTQGGSPAIVLEVNSGTTTESEEFVVTNTSSYDLVSMYVQDDPDGGDWDETSINNVKAGFLFDNKLG